jgi:hypothetical protein
LLFRAIGCKHESMTCINFFLNNFFFFFFFFISLLTIYFIYITYKLCVSILNRWHALHFFFIISLFFLFFFLYNLFTVYFISINFKYIIFWLTFFIHHFFVLRGL